MHYISSILDSVLKISLNDFIYKSMAILLLYKWIKNEIFKQLKLVYKKSYNAYIKVIKLKLP